MDFTPANDSTMQQVLLADNSGVISLADREDGSNDLTFPKLQPSKVEEKVSNNEDGKKDETKRAREAKSGEFNDNENKTWLWLEKLRAELFQEMQDAKYLALLHEEYRKFLDRDWTSCSWRSPISERRITSPPAKTAPRNSNFMNRRLHWLQSQRVSKCREKKKLWRRNARKKRRAAHRISTENKKEKTTQEKSKTEKITFKPLSPLGSCFGSVRQYYTRHTDLSPWESLRQTGLDSTTIDEQAMKKKPNFLWKRPFSSRKDSDLRGEFSIEEPEETGLPKITRREEKRLFWEKVLDTRQNSLVSSSVITSRSRVLKTVHSRLGFREPSQEAIKIEPRTSSESEDEPD